MDQPLVFVQRPGRSPNATPHAPTPPSPCQVDLRTIYTELDDAYENETWMVRSKTDDERVSESHGAGNQVPPLALTRDAAAWERAIQRHEYNWQLIAEDVRMDPLDARLAYQECMLGRSGTTSEDLVLPTTPATFSPQRGSSASDEQPGESSLTKSMLVNAFASLLLKREENGDE